MRVKVACLKIKGCLLSRLGMLLLIAWEDSKPLHRNFDPAVALAVQAPAEKSSMRETHV